MFARLVRTHYAALVLSGMILLGTTLVAAELSDVQFDVPAVLAVRQLDSPDQMLRGPGEKLISIHLPVSTYIKPRREESVEQMVISLESSSANFQIVDFLPRTTLEPRMAGPVSVQANDERHVGFDLDATGFYKYLTGATFISKFSDDHHRRIEFDLLPPQDVVVASGTTHRGQGVYFKLSASTNESLEGAKDFFIIARVPQAWRGDVVRVRCSADRQRREPMIKRDFSVALHLAGDAGAHQLARQFVGAEQDLRRAATEQRRRTQQDASTKLLQKIGAAEPVVSPQWLSEFLNGQSRPETAERLPKPVRVAALQYKAIRDQLQQLSGEFAAREATSPSVSTSPQ